MASGECIWGGREAFEALQSLYDDNKMCVNGKRVGGLSPRCV